MFEQTKNYSKRTATSAKRIVCFVKNVEVKSAEYSDKRVFCTFLFCVIILESIAI